MISLVIEIRYVIKGFSKKVGIWFLQGRHSLYWVQLRPYNVCLKPPMSQYSFREGSRYHECKTKKVHTIVECRLPKSLLPGKWAPLENGPAGSCPLSLFSIIGSDFLPPFRAPPGTKPPLMYSSNRPHGRLVSFFALGESDAANCLKVGLVKNPKVLKN